MSFAHRPFTSALSDWLDATLTAFRKRNTRVFYTAAEPPFKKLVETVALTNFLLPLAAQNTFRNYCTFYRQIYRKNVLTVELLNLKVTPTAVCF